MSYADKHQTRKTISNAVDNYYTADLGTTTGMLSQDWLYPDFKKASIDQFPLFAPPVNLAEDPLNVFGTEANGPFSAGPARPLPTTVSAADLNLNSASTAPVGNVTSQPSRTTSSSDDSLLLGSGGADNSGSLTTPDDSELNSKPTYKPGWATASNARETSRISSSTPCSKKRAKINMSPVTPRRKSPRNLSLSFTQPEDDIKEEPCDPSSPETGDPNASKSKRSHNLTEKKYRTRLNGYFETLLSAIPRPTGPGEMAGSARDTSEKKISKGEVLVLAMEYIRDLERDQNELEQQRKALSSDMEHLKDASSGMEGESTVY
jgi:hypothetical protein